MATIHAMPAPTPIAQEAVECDVHIRTAVKAYHSSFGSLAFWGWKLKRLNGYKALGYASEYDYFLSLNVSRSWYFHAVSIGQACVHLSEQELGDIPVGTAELMLSVRDEIRTLYPWAEEARTLSYGQFARNVEERNAQLPGESRTPMSVLSVRVPATARDAMLGNIKSFKDRHELRSPGQALEFMIADRWDRKGVLPSLEEARKLFGWCSYHMDRTPGIDEELKKRLRAGRAKLEEAYQELIAFNREDRSDAVREETDGAAEAGAGNQADDGW